MLEDKVIFGSLAVLVGFAAYFFYLRNIFLGRTKPHAFSWLAWGMLTAIAFAAQLSEHAGPGAWVTGTTTGICFVIFLLALFKGKKDFPVSDWLCLVTAGLAIILWLGTKEAIGAVILIVIADALAFVPTFRKGYEKPHEETILSYALNGLKFLFSIFALETLNPTTILYPAYLILANFLFVALILARRMKKI